MSRFTFLNEFLHLDVFVTKKISVNVTVNSILVIVSIDLYATILNRRTMQHGQITIQEVHKVCRKLRYFILTADERRPTGWSEKNVPNFRMALCNRVDEMNQQKSMYVMSKHLRICL